jgi:hypothetical protein
VLLQKPERDQNNRDDARENKYHDSCPFEAVAHDITETIHSPFASNFANARFVSELNRCVVVVGQTLVSPGNYFALTFWAELS